ncbi:MAG: CCA tRNA nucleotidyltransferase [Gemmatimonadota bacterium]|nr:CCA tRNA nucleotidyltransferase [Gemmatimonadota bacterium]
MSGGNGDTGDRAKGVLGEYRDASQRMALEAPAAVRWIARTLEAEGFETWAVGGAVRDALLGHPSGDWDLATRARPEDMVRIFKRTVPIGIDHGTVGVLARDGQMYEVTTFRHDVETDGRHAVVSFADRIEDDLARRDFTINAIAWHPGSEHLLDPFGGRRDLASRVLRTVGDPAERFREDHLRVLRAFRFAGRFGLRVETGTWTALRSVTEELRHLSAERIRDELLKVLEADPCPSTALELYRTSGALAVLYPELAMLTGSHEVGTSTSPWDRACATVDALPRGRPILRLAGLLSGMEPERVAAVLIRLRLSNQQVERVSRVASAPHLPPSDAPDADFRRWLSRTGRDFWNGAVRVQLARARAGNQEGAARHTRPAELLEAWRRARRVRDQEPPLEVGDLALDGRSLIALGLKPGPRFGAILDDLLEWVLEDPERNREERLVERVLASGGGHGA